MASSLPGTGHAAAVVFTLLERATSAPMSAQPPSRPPANTGTCKTLLAWQKVERTIATTAPFWDAIQVHALQATGWKSVHSAAISGGDQPFISLTNAAAAAVESSWNAAGLVSSAMRASAELSSTIAGDTPDLATLRERSYICSTDAYNATVVAYQKSKLSTEEAESFLASITSEVKLFVERACKFSHRSRSIPVPVGGSCLGAESTEHLNPSLRTAYQALSAAVTLRAALQKDECTVHSLTESLTQALAALSDSSAERAAPAQHRGSLAAAAVSSASPAPQPRSHPWKTVW